MTSAIDLSSLTAPGVIEALSFEDIVAAMKADHIGRYPPEEQAAVAALLDLESDPTTKLIETAAYRELLLRARYNDEAKALLLAFARSADLDHIGVTYYQEARLIVTPGNPAAIPPVSPVYETDEDYRYRLSLKPESYSTAGPRDAYEFHALSADGRVKSVSVTSPRPGTTRIYVLSREGRGVPTQDILDNVSAALSAEDVRPESEEVVVSAGTVIDYRLDIALTLYPGAIGEVAIEAAQKSLIAYAAGKHRLNNDIVVTAVHAAGHQPGVKRVSATSLPADIDCGPGEAPYCTGIAVTVAGIEQ